MFIDSHQHFWKYNPSRHAWIDASMETLRRDFMPKDLEGLLDSNGLDGCIAVQADQSENETDFLLKCSEKNPCIKGVVGWLDLRANDIEEKLQAYSANTMLKGLRHIVQDEQDDYFMLRPDFQRGMGLLSKYGLCYDILVYEKQLPAAVELVKNFPDQRFVLDHIAKPRINGTIDRCWKHYIEELGRHKNISCKVSGLVTEAAWGKWKKEDFWPYLDVVFNAFGTERLMFGSDWPVCLLSATYNEVLEILEDYLNQFPEDVKAKIMGLNAVSFYKLKI
ncbi:amidohydrolase family protein [Flagellimonas flava]|uniref:L-fuconolactonase n=1 Tax=Flagellimonas flava TaxID=570519 RepID=A0A1M5MCV8_9FLAO|nr:amidohydrolase family protein [Allomuricauda flava]SHG74563.1 L-fuconolactonase [Allomuricauda flava]